MPPNPTGSSNGSGNLFLEADPDATPRASQQAPPHAVPGVRAARRRGSGLIVRVGASSSSAAAATHRPDASAFTRPAKRPGSLPGRTREHLRRADANARRLVAQLAARPYRALLALALVGATLLALSWMALALRNAAAERHSAERRAAAATTALEQERDLAANAIQHDQTRIATLSRQLEQSPRRRTAAAGASHRARHRELAGQAGRKARPTGGEPTHDRREARDEHRDDKHPRGHARAPGRDDQAEGPDRCATRRADARVPGRRAPA